MTESWVQPDSVQKPKRGYWYAYYERYCPQCGSTEVIKERVYDQPRPATYLERHEMVEAWDYCGAF